MSESFLNWVHKLSRVSRGSVTSFQINVGSLGFEDLDYVRQAVWGHSFFTDNLIDFGFLNYNTNGERDMYIVVHVAYTSVSVHYLCSVLVFASITSASLSGLSICLAKIQSTLVVSQWSDTLLFKVLTSEEGHPLSQLVLIVQVYKTCVFLHQKHPLPVHKRSCRVRVGISFQDANSDSHHKHNTFLMGLSAVFQISCWAWLSVTYLFMYPDYPGLSTGRLDRIHSQLLMTKYKLLNYYY